MKMKTNPAHNSSTMEPMLRRSPYLSALCTDPQSGPLGPSAVARRPRSQPQPTTTTTSTSAGARGCGTGGNSSDPSSTATGTSTRSNKRKASDAGSHGSGNFAELFELRRPSSGSQNNGNGSNNNVDALVSQLRIQSMHSIAEAGSSGPNADNGNSAAKRRASNIRSGRRSSTPSFDTSVSGGGFAPASTAVDSDPTTRKFQYYHPNPFTSTNNLVARLAEEKELVGSSSSSTTTGSSSAAQSTTGTTGSGSARRVSAPLVSEYGSESDSSTSGLDSNPTTPTATQRRTVSSANYAKRRTRTLPVMTTSVTANFFPAVLDRGDGDDAGARNEAWKTIKLEYWDDRGGRVNEPPESLGGPSPSPQNASMGQAPRGMSSSLPANYPPSSSTTASGDAPSDMTSALASSFVRRDESTDRFARLVSEFSKSSAGGFHFGSSGPSSGGLGRPSGGRRGGNAGGTSGMHRSRTEAGLSFGRIGPEMMSSSLPRR